MTAILSGSFAGNGTSVAVTGLGAQLNWLLFAVTGVIKGAWTSSMAADAIKPLVGTTALGTGGVTIDAAGFTVGNNVACNTSGQTVHWIGGTTTAGECAVSSYTGSAGADNRTVATGVNASAGGLTIVLPATAVAATVRTTGMPAEVAAGDLTSRTFDGALVSNRIQKEDASNGFQIGSALNTDTVVYHYIQIKDTASLFKAFTHDGNGVNDRQVSTGLTGANAGMVFGNVIATGGGFTGALRLKDHAGTTSALFTAAADVTTGIRGWHTDGPTLGTGTNVNSAATNRYYGAYFVASTTVVSSGSAGRMLLLGVG